MKRLVSLFTTLALALGFATVASAQGTIVEASDFASWVAVSNNSVPAAASSFTVRGNGFFTTSKGVSFTPFATTTAIAIEAAGGTAETVTPSAVTCASNALENTCVITATFSFLHNAGFRVRSGDLGLDEASRVSAVGSLVYVHKAATVTLTAAATFTSTAFIP